MVKNIPTPSSSLSETRQRILVAATQVFAEKGYAGATTRAIAAAAGVNEVTLFRHFGDKKTLMLAVIEQGAALPDMQASLRDQLTGDCRKDLLSIGGQVLTKLIEERRGILMSIFEADRFPELHGIVAAIPNQRRQMISRYLQTQMGRGALRSCNPDVAAQAFLGMLLAYSISLGLADGSLADIPTDEMLAHFVDIFLDGVRKK